MKYDLLHIQGKPYVLVPMHDFRNLTGDGDDQGLPTAIKNDIVANPAQTVKIIRKHRGLTQSDLAKKAGISRPYLTEIETGRKQGSVKALKGIGSALDIDIGMLLNTG